MELRQASYQDMMKVVNALRYKDLSYITKSLVNMDYNHNRLYVVADGKKVYATVSLVAEPNYNYTAIKRLCILNKKNRGKGIARFALHEIQRMVSGRIGATPWMDNGAVRHILEMEGFVLQYVFNERWCYYAKG